ncbi:SubName: Full=Uncharacterized protein {ECO:0000313/EMBL:CCA68497.1} [Serendipita indica DSM 11827]|nr:SubName: Full=Uncharacterized protein {ECO:0000313/EMBL:CCA68497.1} [Serendipita indica DSM 11827]
MAAYTDEWVTGPSDTKFFTRTQAPAEIKGAVVFVHGFIEHLGRYDFVREALVSKGFAVLFYDQRGFGQTALDKARRSVGSAYGKNTRAEMLDDVQFMLNHAREKFKTKNLFLYGHSMGGAIVLQYCCVGNDDLNVKCDLRGVVATSPLLRQAVSAPAWQLVMGHMAQNLTPWMSVPAKVNAADLCHDDSVGKAYLADPLVIQQGTLRGVDTMLRGGAETAEKHYLHWPESLPVFLFHGTEDKVTSAKATHKFHDDIKAKDKHLQMIEGGFHELHNEPEFKVKLLEDITAWFLAHLSQQSETTAAPPEASTSAAPEEAAASKL